MDDALEVTGRLHECRGQMQLLLGQKYEEKMEPIRALIRTGMKRKEWSAAKVALEFGTILVEAGADAMVQVKFFAAAADVMTEV